MRFVDRTGQRFGKLIAVSEVVPRSSTRKESRRRGNGDYTYNGIDRVDNTRGYTLDNVVPCCFKCNRAKDTMTKEEFLEWVGRVATHSLGTKK